MDTEDIHELIDDLSGDITELETALEPLIKEALAASSSKLPVLDKAKLYVLATYAIESSLFSYLRLNGTNAKDHPVFQELTRVRAYFGKIKNAEGGAAGANEPGARLNKGAAQRFIKHDLSGNRAYDRERAAREVHGKKRKLEDIAVGTHTRFDASVKDMNKDLRIVKASEATSESEEDDDDSSLAGLPDNKMSSVRENQGPAVADGQKNTTRSAKRKRNKSKK